jgi:putative transposase
LVGEWKDRFPTLVEWPDESIEEPLAVFELPEAHRKRLRTTYGRYHQENRRGSRVIRIFPNPASCLRLESAMGMEQLVDWLTGHRYLNMEVKEEKSIEVIEPMRLAVVVT